MIIQVICGQHIRFSNLIFPISGSRWVVSTVREEARQQTASPTQDYWHYVIHLHLLLSLNAHRLHVGGGGMEMERRLCTEEPPLMLVTSFAMAEERC